MTFYVFCFASHVFSNYAMSQRNMSLHLWR